MTLDDAVAEHSGWQLQARASAQRPKSWLPPDADSPRSLPAAATVLLPGAGRARTRRLEDDHLIDALFRKDHGGLTAGQFRCS